MTNDEFVQYCIHGNLEKVKEGLKDSNVDPEYNSNISLIFAIKNNHLEVVKMLLQDPRVNPKYFNNYTIGLASEHGQYEIVKMLLKDPRINAGYDHNYSIRHAADNGHYKVVKLLLTNINVLNGIFNLSINEFKKFKSFLINKFNITEKELDILYKIKS
jgi:ankyrin repeat protein